MKLPEAYLIRMQDQLKKEYPAYLNAMAQPPSAALRVNTLKILPERLKDLLQTDLTRIGDWDDAYAVPEGFRPGYDPLHCAGLYYMQEASAQAPARLPEILPGMAVLDLCAAPGGKTTQLAARMQNSGILIANEYVPSRANILAGNLERMGVTNAVVTNMDTSALCVRLAESFDVVLCDAPCAGEGMFRKDAKAVEEWSEEHVRACAFRERGILENAEKAVKPGGQLVYSTCSFSPEEDEQTTAWFLHSHPGFSLKFEQKLYPHTFPGEGQYCALFEKDGSLSPSVFLSSKSDRVASWEAFSEQLAPLKGRVLRLKDGRVLLVPSLPFSLDGLKTVRAGLLLGEDKGNRFEPSHALALSSGPSPFLHTEELDEEEVFRYLTGETIGRNSEKGWCAVRYQGFSLGLMKSDGQILKNHYPKGLRLLEKPRSACKSSGNPL